MAAADARLDLPAMRFVANEPSVKSMSNLASAISRWRLLMKAGVEAIMVSSMIGASRIGAYFWWVAGLC